MQTLLHFCEAVPRLAIIGAAWAATDG